MNTSLPLVSVIGLCYNHERFIREALESVRQQTYGAIELIIVDDASTDQSIAVIRSFLQEIEADDNIKTCFLPENLGNCAAFNRGLALAQGKYVIDFATDDIMLPERITQQVSFFEALDETYGVIFSEAQYIDEDGRPLRYHYRDWLKHIYPIPTGDIYARLLSTYFIAAPTMMMRKQVLDELGGYNEQLAYEDFDFWIRSARDYRYAYQDICATQIRKHDHSMSASLYRRGDSQLYSTYLVCLKAKELNRTEEERRALIQRVQYELRQALWGRNWREAKLLFNLWGNLQTMVFYSQQSA